MSNRGDIYFKNNRLSYINDNRDVENVAYAEEVPNRNNPVIDTAAFVGRITATVPATGNQAITRQQAEVLAPSGVQFDGVSLQKIGNQVVFAPEFADLRNRQGMEFNSFTENRRNSVYMPMANVGVGMEAINTAIGFAHVTNSGGVVRSAESNSKVYSIARADDIGTYTEKTKKFVSRITANNTMLFLMVQPDNGAVFDLIVPLVECNLPIANYDIACHNNIVYIVLELENFSNIIDNIIIYNPATKQVEMVFNNNSMDTNIICVIVLNDLTLVNAGISRDNSVTFNGLEISRYLGEAEISAFAFNLENNTPNNFSFANFSISLVGSTSVQMPVVIGFNQLVTRIWEFSMSDGVCLGISAKNQLLACTFVNVPGNVEYLYTRYDLFNNPINSINDFWNLPNPVNTVVVIFENGDLLGKFVVDVSTKPWSPINRSLYCSITEMASSVMVMGNNGSMANISLSSIVHHIVSVRDPLELQVVVEAADLNNDGVFSDCSFCTNNNNIYVFMPVTQTIQNTSLSSADYIFVFNLTTSSLRAMQVTSTLFGRYIRFNQSTGTITYCGTVFSTTLDVFGNVPYSYRRVGQFTEFFNTPFPYAQITVGNLMFIWQSFSTDLLEIAFPVAPNYEKMLVNASSALLELDGQLYGKNTRSDLYLAINNNLINLPNVMI